MQAMAEVADTVGERKRPVALFLWKLPAEGVPLEALSAGAGRLVTTWDNPCGRGSFIWKLPAERIPLVVIGSVAGCLLVGRGHSQRLCLMVG